MPITPDERPDQPRSAATAQMQSSWPAAGLGVTSRRGGRLRSDASPTLSITKDHTGGDLVSIVSLHPIIAMVALTHLVHGHSVSITAGGLVIEGEPNDRALGGPLDQAEIHSHALTRARLNGDIVRTAHLAALVRRALGCESAAG